MSVFKDKVLLITGGTGSFGNAVLRRFLDSDIREIRQGDPHILKGREEAGRHAAHAAEPEGEVLHRQRAQQGER